MIEESIEYHVVMKSVVLQPLSEGLSFTFIGFHCANTKDIYNLNMEKKVQWGKYTTDIPAQQGRCRKQKKN